MASRVGVCRFVKSLLWWWRVYRRSRKQSSVPATDGSQNMMRAALIILKFFLPLWVIFFVTGLPVWTAEVKSPESALVSIRIVPQDVTIGGGDEPSQTFIVLAKYEDGLERA